MVLKDLLVSLILVGVNLFLFCFLGTGSFGLDDVITDLSPPLFDRVQTQQIWIAAALDLPCVYVQVVLQDVQFVVAEGLLLLSENKSFSDLETAVLAELLNCLLQGVLLFLLVLRQGDKSG